MSSYIGNQTCSLQVTETQVQINVDSAPAITLQTGSNIDIHNYTVANLAGLASQLSMNSFKITDLGTATSAGDAMSRSAADARYYLATTALDAITQPAGDLSLNNHKITSLADATADTDALNR
jgi:hypothetical protein